MLNHDSKTEGGQGARFARRFWGRVRKGPRCWTWTGRLHSSGYGVVRISDHGRRPEILAHRAAWALKRGPIPAGRQVLHRCDNPPCVRPEHLFLGTDVENKLDAKMKGLIGVHRDPIMLLTLAQVAEIRAGIRAGRRHKDLARAYGVSQPLIRAIHQRRAWHHVA